VEAVRKALGVRVRSLRSLRGLSQEQLAEAGGLHWTHISGIERGQYNLTLETLCKLAAGLGISLSDLFDGVDVRAPRRKVSR
jgi:transcriptional regulator with XRE-family HTH domain